MTTFNMTKKAEDIKGRVNVPEDWYNLEILEEPLPPEECPNKKKLAGASEAEGGGDNIILRLRLNHEDPMYDGRRFSVYLPYPNESDKKTYAVGGQTKEDSKNELIVAVYAAFADLDPKDVEGDEIDFSLGDKAEFYVNQGLNQQGTEMINEVNVFRNLPRPVGG